MAAFIGKGGGPFEIGADAAVVVRGLSNTSKSGVCGDCKDWIRSEI